MTPAATTRSASRIAGSGLALGMLLLVGGVLLHPSELDPAMRSYPSYVPIHVLILSGLVLSLPGLLVLLGRSLRSATWLDWGAALLCTWGWTLFAGQILYEGLAVPGILRQIPDATIDVLDGPATPFYLIGAVCFAVGFVLLGFRLPRAGTPVWASRLLLVAPLPILWPPLPDWLGKLSVAVFATGLAALGLWLVRSD